MTRRDPVLDRDKAPPLTEPITIRQIEEAIDLPVADWAHQCHAVSIKIVKSKVLGKFARVARGGCKDVGGQHSWVVLGRDCYARDVPILDATIWSYQDKDPYLWWGTTNPGIHYPHGNASIWEWGRPEPAQGPVIDLAPKEPLSRDAEFFLELLGPLDLEGWRMLSHAPALGWPAGEIFAAIQDTEALTLTVPIDMLGMLTYRNPSHLYLADEDTVRP